MFHAPWARCRPYAFKHRCESHHEERHQWPGENAGPWGPGDPFMRHPPHSHGHEAFDGGPFSTRRPLRFLAHKLDLDEKQFKDLARILDELKTERAQAAVDDRRTLSDYADAMSGESFDAAKAGTGATRRADSNTRVNAALVKALQQIHALLNPEQREKFAYLVRTGFLTM
jgi:Spy/CpxP family protein refolding chaperone